MDAPVLDQFFNTDPGDFPSDGVKARQDHGLRRVVDDEVHTCKLLDRADVTAFTADNPTLHLFVGQGDDGDSRFRHIVAGIALDRRHDNFARPFLCCGSGFVFNFLVQNG